MISNVSPARAFGLISENVVLISKVSPARFLGLLSENAVLISKVSPLDYGGEEPGPTGAG